jgi:sterol desaturase/sphingolipid hydroxylase (fatty acid hydroxylase superfamily)
MFDYLMAAFLGVFGWTFAEYALHHWVFHRLKIQTVGKKEHLRHHAKAGYFTSTQLKIKLGIVVFSLIYIVMEFVVGIAQAEVFTLTLAFSYGWYERVHNRHHTTAPKSRYGAWLRKHHFIHHFHDARVNHGVTTPIWDLVFRTYQNRAVVVVPRKFAMSWLLDGVGSVKSKYAGDYRLR